MIRITSKKDGFRRCGVAHSETPTLYEDDRFSAEDLKTLKAERMLIVETGVKPEKPTDKGRG